MSQTAGCQPPQLRSYTASQLRSYPQKFDSVNLGFTTFWKIEPNV